MNLRKVISGCLAALLAISSVVRVSAAARFPDYDKNAWYAEAVSAAVEHDLLRGANGRLNLQGDLTRGEMAAITNRAFGTYVKANISKFRDVPKDAWYYPDLQMAYFMGTYEGTGANTMAPDKPISRQEVMTVVARALQLDLERYENTSLTAFGDGNEVSDWALPYVKAMVGAGYIQGRNTGLDPLDHVTRAEFCQIFHNIIREYIVKGGSYTGDRTGNLLIRTDNVVLHDTTIDGDLILGNGIGDGRVVLDNVTVTGRVIVWGGGTEAVYMNNGTTLPELIVCRVDNPVKVVFDQESTLAVHDSIQTEITARAGRYRDTEIVFYDIDDILDTVEDLNTLVDSSRISVTVPAHLYALVNESTINTRFSNDSQSDTYRIELRRKGQTELLADVLELSAGEICREIELYEPLPWGNYDCIATVTALRDGQVFGTLEIALTLHAAHLWSTGG